MIGIWVLLGFGVLAGVSGLFDGGSDGGETTQDATAPEPEATDTNGLTDAMDATAGPTLSQSDESTTEDLVFSENYREELEGQFAYAVAVGELTQAEADEIAATVQYEEPAMTVDTGGGDDIVFAERGADTIQTGAGDDFVLGGTGSDSVSLGDGDDLYGLQSNFGREAAASISYLGTESSFERGNDTVFGNRGDDQIYDGYGQDFLDGGNGNDTISATDQGDLNPDTVIGGLGNDWLLVDQGDDVSTGAGEDIVSVDLERSGLAAGYLPTVVRDYDPETDRLILDIDGAKPLVTVSALADGAGSSVQVDGVPVVTLLGVNDLPVEAIEVFDTLR